MRAIGILALAGAIAASGCSTPDAADQDESNIILLVNEVALSAGGGAGADSAFLLSDVVRVVDPAGVFNDNAIITLESVPKNQNPGLTLSSYDTVALERYTVRYFRSDGRNGEGTDIPYSFQGALAGAVSPGGETDVALIVVRHQAKQEPPLNRLQGGGGADILTCFAEVSIYGKTLAGDVVTARATVSITFADFGDE